MAYSKARLLIMAGAILAGSAGAAYADNDNRDVLRSTNGEIVRSSNGNCVRTNWMTGQDACAPPVLMVQNTVVQESAAARLTQEQRTVYFNFNRYDLTPESTARLDTLVNVLKADKTVKEAKIVGYADRIGSAAYNDKLSQERAQSVLSYLVNNGYTNASVTETHWVGKSQPITNCPPMSSRNKLIACLQNDRRVEVDIVFFDNGAASGGQRQ